MKRSIVGMAVAILSTSGLASAQTSTSVKTTSSPSAATATGSQTTTVTTPTSSSSALPPAPSTPPVTTPATNDATSAAAPGTTSTTSSIAPSTTTTLDSFPKTENRFLNRPLFVTGLVVLGGSYAASAISAGTSNRPEDDRLYYPVVGPWMDLANRDCSSRGCDNKTLDTTLLIASGIGQGLGALAVVTSLFVPEKTTRNWYLIGNSEWHLAPGSVGRYGYGLGASGRF